MVSKIRKPAVFLISFILLFLVISAVTFGQNQDDQGDDNNDQGGGGRGVPEPGTLALLGAGLASLGLYAWKKRKRG